MYILNIVLFPLDSKCMYSFETMILTEIQSNTRMIKNLSFPFHCDYYWVLTLLLFLLFPVFLSAISFFYESLLFFIYDNIFAKNAKQAAIHNFKLCFFITNEDLS